MPHALHGGDHCFAIIIDTPMLDAITCRARFEYRVTGAQIGRERIADAAGVDQAHTINPKIEHTVRMTDADQIGMGIRQQ